MLGRDYQRNNGGAWVEVRTKATLFDIVHNPSTGFLGVGLCVGVLNNMGPVLPLVMGFPHC